MGSRTRMQNGQQKYNEKRKKKKMVYCKIKILVKDFHLHHIALRTCTPAQNNNNKILHTGDHDM